MAVMTLTRSTIGKKVIMAVTGLVWIGFLVFHMYGNLKVYQGAEYFNHYAESLRELGMPLFSRLHLLTLLRIIVTVSVLAHIWAAISLTKAARNARPQNYEMKRLVQANYASITMRYGGLVIALFLLYHLAHFTWGLLPIPPSGFVKGDAYHNLVGGFQSIFNVLLYLVAVAALGFHLYHGTWSMFQTLGFNNQKYDSTLRGAALALGILISVGFAIVPLSVLFGFVTL
jgi:succinate dehydrogenase / fumarate reductase, cytochrome b subunit